MSVKRIYSINQLPTSKTDWKKVSALSEAKINARALSDPDALPLTVHQLKNLKRVHPLEEIDVKKIRKKLGFSQEVFSAVFGISKRTLQEWEQGKRHPTGAAETLMVVISHEPKAVQRALFSSREAHH